MELDDAIRCALQDETFYGNMRSCYARPAVEFLSFVREEDANVFAGEVSLNNDLEGDLAGYVRCHPKILEQRGIVFLSKWKCFSREYLAKLFADSLTGKIRAPEEVLHREGLQPDFADFQELDVLRRHYRDVALLCGYSTLQSVSEFTFLAYQQRAPISHKELSMIWGRPLERLEGYYSVVGGRRFQDGTVRFTSLPKKEPFVS